MSKRWVSWSAVLVLNVLLLAGWFYFCSSPRVTHAAAPVRYVAPGGSCGAAQPCYGTVQAAVDAAVAGDEVRVAEGVYTGVETRDGEVQIVYLSKNITLRGGYDLNSWSYDPAQNLTTLDAQGLGRVLYITGDIAPTVDGLRITGGQAAEGGGVSISSAIAVLTNNEIYSNTATTAGGGVYLKNSPSRLSANQIYNNVTGGNGYGGGVAIINSAALLEENTINGNRAHVGAGIELVSNTTSSGATLRRNTVQGNTAFDYTANSITFDGAGGGISIHSTRVDTLDGNVISLNKAKWGGGVHITDSPAAIIENTIQENDAPVHGGGLYVQGGSSSIVRNRILKNQAISWGGGLFLSANEANVSGNTFQDNTAGWRGGGLYTQSAGDFTNNVFTGNISTGQGGGIFIVGDSGAKYQNIVVTGNHAAEGAGMYLWGATSRFTNSTISSNTSNDTYGIVIDKYPGLVAPAEPQQTPSSVIFTNTIIAGQTVGIYATDSNYVEIRSVLWHDTITHTQVAPADLTIQDEYTGDPAFTPDGYHITPGLSAAQDLGVTTGFTLDIDDQLLTIPANTPDLGADEAMQVVSLTTPSLTGLLSDWLSFTLDHGTDPIASQPVDLAWAPIELDPSYYVQQFPGYYMDVCDACHLFEDPFETYGLSPLGFELEAYQNGELLEGYTFADPITLTINYSDTVFGNSAEDLLDVRTLNETTDEWEEAACGPVQQDLSLNKLQIPICHLSRYAIGVIHKKAYLPAIFLVK